eukprot:scaffold97629_cov46-Phaeocystis_antarctica.AAC.1
MRASPPADGAAARRPRDEAEGRARARDHPAYSRGPARRTRLVRLPRLARRRQRLGPEPARRSRRGATPAWSTAVTSAALEAAGSSTHGRGRAPSGWASPWEC